MAAATVMADQPLESRVARLESDVAHIRSDIADMKLDIRALRGGLEGVREQLQKSDASTSLKLADLDHKLTRGIASTRISMLLLGAAILGVMARGFGWL